MPTLRYDYIFKEMSTDDTDVKTLSPYHYCSGLSFRNYTKYTLMD